MGQSASKAASRVSSRVAQSVQKQTSSQPPPSAATTTHRADPITGFTRGHGPSNPRDEQQQQFLQSQASAQAPTDMPADLLQFLNDAGPLKRPPDATTAANDGTTTTTKRLPRIPGLDPNEPVNDDTSISVSPHADPRRTRQVMPLMANTLEQFGTERTTSFSHTPDTVDPKDFGLDVLDLYRLVSSQPVTSSSSSQQQSDGEATMVLDFYNEHRNDTTDQADHDLHISLVQQTRHYLHAPVLLKDDDDSFVGAFVRDARRLQNMKLELMPKTSVKLVLEDLVDAERKEQEQQEEETADATKQLLE